MHKTKCFVNSDKIKNYIPDVTLAVKDNQLIEGQIVVLCLETKYGQHIQISQVWVL